MKLELVMRFDYGAIVPWVRRRQDGLIAIAGPDGLRLHTPIAVTGRDMRTTAEFEVNAGEQIPFVLEWFPSQDPPEGTPDAGALVQATDDEWRGVVGAVRVQGQYHDEVVRSLLTLECLTYEPTGGPRRRADHVAARERRRHPQLGLPLLLDAGRDAHARCAAVRRVPRRSGAVPRMGAARGRGRSREPADHVRPRRGTAPHRAHARLDAGLARIPSGAHRQRGARADAARRVRRARRRHVAQRARRGSRSTTTRGSCSWCCSSRSRRSGGNPTTASGRCAARAATSCTRRSLRGSRSIARSRWSRPPRTAARVR